MIVRYAFAITSHNDKLVIIQDFDVPPDLESLETFLDVHPEIGRDDANPVPFGSELDEEHVRDLISHLSMIRK